MTRRTKRNLPTCGVSPSSGMGDFRFLPGGTLATALKTSHLTDSWASRASSPGITRFSETTAASVGDLTALVASFERTLRATNKSPRTIDTYMEAADQLIGFLRRAGMPTEAARITRYGAYRPGG